MEDISDTDTDSGYGPRGPTRFETRTPRSEITRYHEIHALNLLT